MGAEGDAADEDGADGVEVFGDFDGHDAAEGEADEDKGLGPIDLVCEAEGVVSQGFVVLRGDPVDVVCPAAFREMSRILAADGDISPCRWRRGSRA